MRNLLIFTSLVSCILVFEIAPSLAKKLTKGQQSSYAAAMTGLAVADTCNRVVGGYATSASFFRGPASKGERAILGLGGSKALVRSVDRKHRRRLKGILKSKAKTRRKFFCDREIRKWRRKVRHK